MAVADDEPVLLAEVAAELAQSVPSYPPLGNAAAGGRLKPVELEELPELAAFATDQHVLSWRGRVLARGCGVYECLDLKATPSG
jgi:hypothetical protein